MYLTPLLNGFPFQLGIGALGQKTKVMALPSLERSLMISLAIWIQYANVTDGQTDGRTPGNSKDRAYV